jgi:two-component system nitrogen regulation response regulator NtrX
MDGLEVFRLAREKGYDSPVIIVTGHGDVSTAVQATRQGAFDFFEKPLQRERVLLSLRNAVESYLLRQDRHVLADTEVDLVGSSVAIKRLRETISTAAPTRATVLITGESGTGKELVARSIHRQSERKSGPMIHVNCAAIPDELIESELFGHEKGSFTGAVRKQVGKFVSANGGTIFLDEIGDMSGRTQAKVLRVLENGEIEPVGAQKPTVVDVRVVAATNRDLPTEIEDGKFREDLYYRLNVLPIETPPLREHLEDLPQLVEYFVRKFSASNNYRDKSFSDEALARLQELEWKGNVRELRNVVERLLILSPGDAISATDVNGAVGGVRSEMGSVLLSSRTLREFREAAEKIYLEQRLAENDWNVTKTAKMVETPRSNLYKKMEQYGIKRQSNIESDA